MFQRLRRRSEGEGRNGPEIRLDFLGGASVTVDGVPLTGRSVQPRRVALLAVLAASPRCSATRDRLVALLWPETTDRKGRKLLATSLWQVRKALGVDAVVASGDRIALDPERVRSDVARFRERAADAPVEAVELYGGPFLDGFHVRGSPGFEEWLQGERRELSALYARALWAAAEDRERTGDAAGSIELRRRLARHEPTDARAARGLMEVLVAAGDRAGALEHARRYAAEVEERFGLVPDPDILDLAEEIRAGGESAEGTWPSIPEEPVPPPGVDGEGRGRPDRPYADQDAREARPAAPRRAGRRWSPPAAPFGLPGRRGAWLATEGLLTLIVLVGLMVRPHPSVEPADPRLLAVVPARVSGADASVAYLREGVVDLFGARIGEEEPFDAVDPRSLLAAWRAAGGGAEDLPLSEARRMARRLGAGVLVLPEVVGPRHRLTLAVTLVRTRDGAVVGREYAVGPVDSLSALVDRVMGGLSMEPAERPSGSPRDCRRTSPPGGSAPGGGGLVGRSAPEGEGGDGPPFPAPAGPSARSASLASSREEEPLGRAKRILSPRRIHGASA